MDRQLCDTSVIVKMDNNRDLDMESIIKNVECWYQEIAQKSKEEVDAFYQTRVGEEDLGARPAAYRVKTMTLSLVSVSGASGQERKILRRSAKQQVRDFRAHPDDTEAAV